MIEKVNKGKGEEVQLPLSEGVIIPKCYKLCEEAGHPCGSQSLNGWDYAIGVIY
jgi:hypothetical protein